MCQYVQCGGAARRRRGSVALTSHRGSRRPMIPPLQLPAWSRSRAVFKCLHSFQSLQVIPIEKCHLWVGVRKL